MDTNQNRYWPFAVPALERQSDLQRQEVGFLEAAFQAGHAPYMFGAENFGATGGDRAGEIFLRGREHWEVAVVVARQPAVSAHLTNFAAAADALLSWLRGATEAEMVERVRPSLLISRATGPGFKLLSGRD